MIASAIYEIGSRQQGDKGLYTARPKRPSTGQKHPSNEDLAG